jgi:hypothetical protein
VLSGFTLTNGSSFFGGAGVVSDADYSEPSGVVTNCTLTRNRGWRGGGASGCTLYNCTLSDNVGLVESGGGANRSTLYNCTLTGNEGQIGGGAYHSTLYNCKVVGNWADYVGGGVCQCILYNCVVADNVAGDLADDRGGGACGSTLFNCTLTGNSASSGGGAAICTLYNSIIYYNFDFDNFGGNYSQGTILNYCCTSPLPTNGVGNITGPPLFMDMAAGDVRLREDSLCIDAGTNLVGLLAVEPWGGPFPYTHDATDFLGNTRFIDGNGDGTVAWDIGAYEFNSFKPFRFTVSPVVTLSEEPFGPSRNVRLNITGAPNILARVQKSGNLKDWKDIWSGRVGAEGVTQVNDRQRELDYDEGGTVMFYRVVVGGP